MALKGQAKTDYQRDYMRRRRAGLPPLSVRPTDTDWLDLVRPGLDPEQIRGLDPPESVVRPRLDLEQPSLSIENTSLDNLKEKREEGELLEGEPIVWPDWYAALYAIQGFTTSLAHAEEWITRNGLAIERVEETAYAVKSKWPPSKNHKDPWATFQNWVKRPPIGGTNGRKPLDAGPNDVARYIEAEKTDTKHYQIPGSS